MDLFKSLFPIWNKLPNIYAADSWQVLLQKFEVSCDKFSIEILIQNSI